MTNEKLLLKSADIRNNMPDADYDYLYAFFSNLPVQERMFPKKLPNEISNLLGKLTEDPYHLRKIAGTLRKNNLPHAALHLLSALSSEEQKNIYSARESGWTLRACIKDIEERKKSRPDIPEKIFAQKLIELARQFESLFLPESETKLLSYRTRYSIKYIATKQDILDAFERAKSAFCATADDKERLVDYSWFLWECLTAAIVKFKDRDLIELLKAEYQALDIPVNEENPFTARARLIAKANQYLSGSNELREIAKKDGASAAIKHARDALEKDKNNHFLRAEFARLLDEEKDFSGAIGEWRRLVKQFPENTNYQTSFAWSMIKRLTGLNKDGIKDKDHIERIINFFRQVNLLSAIEKPSLVYSLYLSHCTASCKHFIETENEAIAEAYLELVNAWGLEHLREDDFKAFEPEAGKSFPSLCEKIIKTLYKSLKICNKFVHAKWVSEFIGANFERYPEQQWFPFYYGKVLLWAGEFDKAREYLLKTVRLKRDEFWAWAILAETFKNDDQKGLTSLCRALQCKTKDEGYKVNVREQLGVLLRKLGEAPAARYEFTCVDRIRAERNWTAITRTQEFNDWLHSGEKAASNDAMYKKYASSADALVFGELSTIEAILECILTIENNKGKKRIAIIGFFSNGNYESIRFSGVKRFPFLERKPDGAPLNIQIEHTNEGLSIVNISERSDGKLWDICPEKIAVISAVDTGKGHSVATFDRGKTCKIDHKRLPTAKSWAPGTVIELKIRHNKEYDHYSALYGVATKLPLPRELCKSFSGPLQVSANGTFAFVVDVFIDSILFASLGNMRSGIISGLAVVSLDRKKGKLGWKAITVEK